jgi:hypothetical protein
MTGIRLNTGQGRSLCKRFFNGHEERKHRQMASEAIIIVSPSRVRRGPVATPYCLHRATRTESETIPRGGTAREEGSGCFLGNPVHSGGAPQGQTFLRGGGNKGPAAKGSSCRTMGTHRPRQASHRGSFWGFGEWCKKRTKPPRLFSETDAARPLTGGGASTSLHR